MWPIFLAAQAVDIGFFVLALAGLEGAAITPDEVPRQVVTAGHYTHSLLMSAVYLVACVGLGAAFKRPRVGMALGLAVFSHWLCDLLVHTPDLPLAFAQEPLFGLSLWLYPVASWALEVGLLLAAWWWLRPRFDQKRGLDLLLGALLTVQTLSEFVIPTPPTIWRMAASAEALYLAMASAAYWTERRRE